jgi:type IV pilus biogenesis protein CpaD/CtpE
MRIHPVLLVLVIISLVACTQTSDSTSAVVEPTRLPSATVVVIQATDMPLPAPATPATQPTPSMAPALANLDEGAGTTDEGYAMLGDAQAAVTFVDYSDFF